LRCDLCGVPLFVFDFLLLTFYFSFMYLGIEIGGTKLQMGVGGGEGSLAGNWRGDVDAAAGPEGIRRQIETGLPELLERARVKRSDLRAAGVGFGGPVDDATQSVIKSHQIVGWDNFPLAEWVGELVGLPCTLGNDADVAGLAEALFGAGKGLSPIFYITVGSGIGGGLIINGEIYRGVGRGAAEIGHLGFFSGTTSARQAVELQASGWAIQERARSAVGREPARAATLLRLAQGEPSRITTQHVAEAARQADPLASVILEHALAALADAICDMIALLCPRRVVVGGGVSLMGEALFFAPLRALVTARVFAPFAGCYDIVPAALGEEVVVHGALALARKRIP
jgi:glucokinase